MTPTARAEAVAIMALEYSKKLFNTTSNDEVVHTSFSLAERMVDEIDRRFKEAKKRELPEVKAKADTHCDDLRAALDAAKSVSLTQPTKN